MEEDFELHKDTGYWCPDCDGFTFFDTSKMPKYWVILEDKKKGNTIDTSGSRHVSPLRYPGGKSKLAPFIGKLCRPDHMIDFCEPFCGGASVGLYLLLENKIQHLHINDADKGVFSLFNTIKETEKYQRLRERIRKASLSKTWFQTAKMRLQNNYEGLSQEEIAFTFLSLNRMTYSGIVKGGCMHNELARWNPERLINRLDAINEKAERIHVYNMDALAFIEEKYWLKNSTLFIDPPYYANNAEQLYNHFYSEQDHINLSELLNTLYRSFPASDMIITYDFCKQIEALYGIADKIVIGRKYSI